MRQFDTLQTYCDNNGNPLVGRARFCDENGVLKEIRDGDNVVIDSIVFTDASGRLGKQVFLNDSDYYVYFDRYDGDANPYTDNDEDNWNPQFNVKSLYNTFNIVVDTEGEQCVSNIADLRKLDPIKVTTNNDRKFVKLLGYYGAGDKDAVSYFWDNNDTSGADDGGSVIKVTGINQGRWHLVTGMESVDVRHFGAFPMEVAEIDQDLTNRISNAIAYANAQGLKIFFPSTGNEVYFDVSGLTLNNITTSTKARLFAKDSATTNITNVDEVYLYADSSSGLAGTINVMSEILRTSYNVGNYSSVNLKPSARIILDTNYTSLYVWKDLEVFLAVDQSNSQIFRRCTFAGDGKFKGTYSRDFYNCEIRESIFDTSFDYDYANFHDCDSSIILWSTADKYMLFCKKNKSKSIDLDGKEVSKIDIDWDCNLYNGIIKQLYIGNGENDERTLSVRMDNVNFKLYKHSYVKDFVASNVTTSGNTYNLYCTNVISSNSAFTSQIVALTIKSYTSSFADLNFANGLLSSTSFTNNLVITDIDGDVTNVSVNNCNFTGTSQIKFIGSSSSVTSVDVENCVFTGNVMQGTKRSLFSALGVTPMIKNSCYIFGNVNTDNMTETFSAESSVFNGIYADNLMVTNGAQIRGGLQFSLDKDSSVNPPSVVKSARSDYSIIVEYTPRGTDSEGNVTSAKDVKLLVKLFGDWYNVSTGNVDPES